MKHIFIIVTNHAENWIENWIKKYLKLKSSDWFAILIDNNSHDNTFNKMLKYHFHPQIMVLATTQEVNPELLGYNILSSFCHQISYDDKIVFINNKEDLDILYQYSQKIKRKKLLKKISNNIFSKTHSNKHK